MLLGVIFLLEIVSATLIGLVLGSFATAVIHRELNDISWSFRRKRIEGKNAPSAYRSACPQCGEPLKPIDLIPLFSWFSTKGKCRYCEKPIGAIYPATELSAALMSVLIVLFHGLNFYALTLLAIVPFLIALTVIDIKQMILPNKLVLIIAAIGLFSLIGRAIGGTLEGGQIMVHVIAAIMFGMVSLFLGWITAFVLKKDALGMGDVKFFACAGLWLGPMLLADFCFFAGLLGVLSGIAWKKLTKQPVFPFGPAIIASFFVLLLIDGSFLFQFILK